MYRERLVRREKRQRAAALQNFAEFHAAFASVSIRGLLESCSHPATRDWQACNTKKWNRSNCRITRHQFFNSRKLAQFASGLFFIRVQRRQNQRTLHRQFSLRHRRHERGPVAATVKLRLRHERFQIFRPAHAVQARLNFRAGRRPGVRREIAPHPVGET